MRNSNFFLDRRIRTGCLLACLAAFAGPAGALDPQRAMSQYVYDRWGPERGFPRGPVYAIAKAEEKTGLTLEDADLVEINEAFAAQVLAVLKCMRSDEFAQKHLGRNRPVGKVAKERLNVNGGSIALGHPVGATGARLILTSLRELKRRQAQRALVSALSDGGEAVLLAPASRPATTLSSALRQWHQTADRLGISSAVLAPLQVGTRPFGLER